MYSYILNTSKSVMLLVIKNYTNKLLVEILIALKTKILFQTCKECEIVY